MTEVAADCQQGCKEIATRLKTELVLVTRFACPKEAAG